jgi:kojibiose phosphorylase
VLEQHEGYFDLQPVRLKLDENDMPIVPPALRERQGTTQLIKQADVVLLQFLFGDEHDARSKRVNYAYYAPRTTHQSSLSPSTYAVMGAEVGDMAEAWRNFRRTAFMDLCDHQRSVANGIHAASLGGTWMAVVNGFGGMRLRSDGALSFAPRLPEQWRRLRFRVHWHGAQLEVTCRPDRVLVEHLGVRRRVRCPVWGKEVALAPGERHTVKRGD